MAVQIIPLVAAIVGGAVTIGAGAYIYKNYNDAQQVEPASIISQPAKLREPAEEKKPEQKLQVAKPAVPTFDLLRVEKDGSVLISGLSTPNSAVEIVQGDTVLGKTKSAENGDFVVVFDNPLKPGDYELYIRTTRKDGTKTRSLEAAIIAIPEKGGELLAMVSKPSGPSKMIQVTKLEPKAGQRAVEVPKSEVKSAEQAEEKSVENAVKTKTDEAQQKADENQSAQVATAKNEPVKQPEAIAKVESAAKDEVNVAAEETVKQAAKQKPLEVARLEAEPIDGVTVKSAEDAKLNPVDSGKVVPQLRPGKKADADRIASLDDGVKAQQDPVESKPAPVIVQPVFLGAVEVEKDKVYVAGTGHPDHIVNIYIDEKFVGSAKVDAQGTFLMESSSTLTIGKHTVRADMLGNTGATVVARAQVPLIHDQPATPEEIVVAEAAKENIDSEKTPVKKQESVKAVQPETATKEALVADGERQQSAEDVVVAKNEDRIVPEIQKLAKSTGAEVAEAKSVETGNKKLEPTGEQMQVAKLDDNASKAEVEAKQLTRKLVKNDAEKDLEIKTTVKQDVTVVEKSVPKVEKTAKLAPVVEEVAKVAPVVEETAKLAPVVEETAKRAPVVQETAKVAPIVENTDKPEPIIEKTAEPVQVVKSETSPQPDVAKKPMRVIRTSSSVIIRRGDNLWRISRRILGRGIRYSTIYQANRDQIKNPSLIFPGQIFKVPGKMVDVKSREKS